MHITQHGGAVSFKALLLLGVCAGVQVTQKERSLFTLPGGPVKMTCEHTDPSFITMLWYRQSNGSLTLMVTSVSGSDPTFEDSFQSGYELERPQVLQASLKIRAGARGDSATYFCAASREGAYAEAFFGPGTRLTVLEEGLNVTQPSLVLFDPSPQELREKGKATLVCLATNFYPDHVTLKWSVNGVGTTTGVKTDDSPTRGSDKMYSLSSRLRLTKRDWWNPHNTFSCSVHFHAKNITISKETKGREGCGGFTPDSYRTSANTAKLTYVLLISKSALYGLFVTFLAWKLKREISDTCGIIPASAPRPAQRLTLLSLPVIYQAPREQEPPNTAGAVHRPLGEK